MPTTRPLKELKDPDITNCDTKIKKSFLYSLKTCSFASHFNGEIMNKGNFEHHGSAVILIGGSGSLPIIFNGGTVHDLIQIIEEHSGDEYYPSTISRDDEKEFGLSEEVHLNYISGVNFFNGAKNSVYDVSKHISACNGDGYEIKIEGEDEGSEPLFQKNSPVELSVIRARSEVCTGLFEMYLTDYVEEDDVPSLFIIHVSHFKISKEEEARIDAIHKQNATKGITDDDLDKDYDGSIFCENAKWVEMARTCSLVAFAFKNT